jgi:hypothetical protein
LTSHHDDVIIYINIMINNENECSSDSIETCNGNCRMRKLGLTFLLLVGLLLVDLVVARTLILIRILIIRLEGPMLTPQSFVCPRMRLYTNANTRS